MGMFVAVEEGDRLGDEAQALGMAELAVMSGCQDLQPDAERELQRHHPRQQQPVEGRDRRHPHGGQTEVLLGVAKRRFDPPAAPIPRHRLGGGPVGRREQVPLRRDGLESPFEQRGGTAVQARDDQGCGKAPPWATADADEAAHLSRRKGELREQAVIPAMGDAPRLGEAHEIGPVMLHTPLEDGATGEAPVANQHGREASGTGLGQEVVQVVEEGELEAGDLVAHGAVLIGAPQEWNATPAPREDGLEDAKLAAGGRIHDDGQILPVARAPSESGLGERAAQDTTVEAFVLRPAPELLIARIEVTRREGATGEVGQAQGTLAEDQFDEQGKGGGLLREQRGPDGLDQSGELAIPWHTSGLLTRLSE